MHPGQEWRRPIPPESMAVVGDVAELRAVPEAPNGCRDPPTLLGVAQVRTMTVRTDV